MGRLARYPLHLAVRRLTCPTLCSRLGGLGFGVGLVVRVDRIASFSAAISASSAAIACAARAFRLATRIGRIDRHNGRLAIVPHARIVRLIP